MNEQTAKLEILLSENALDVEDFANCLGITRGDAQLLCDGKKKLSKSLARQIEQTFSKPNLWFDIHEDGESEGPNYDLFG